MKKIVYGLMINSGDADEMLWDHGVWETEEAANEYIESEMSTISGVWAGELKVNDSIPDAAEYDEEEMIECPLCGIEYNPEDVNTADYDEAVCINCEPGYKENMNIA
ncbi:hypothetical protein [Mesobacillus selenatarsenatis]|uniref:Uncharacterized protein n=1 Tax=Mesobacillus selenatarsenatis (strain DSM 18680 / JCM 14380 / FERM P-15431 / SF-1) TaxID=1321606 RepID=A0A0A8X7C3_MESS1|nr:hypothetical protein [Mesobacillus selenatarsenatis]GAM15855.1 hypothetical protein SAMD00020551_4025 [Mesobacillus selenatarsenatis SF-1]